MTRFLLLFSLLPAAGALGMLLQWVRARRAEPELRRTGTRTVGTVVDNRSVTTPAGETGYRPVVRFATERGRKVRAVGDTLARRPFPVDSSIAVVYDPKDTQQILTGPGSTQTHLVAAIVFAVIAVIILVIGLLV